MFRSLSLLKTIFTLLLICLIGLLGLKVYDSQYGLDNNYYTSQVKNIDWVANALNLDVKNDGSLAINDHDDRLSGQQNSLMSKSVEEKGSSNQDSNAQLVNQKKVAEPKLVNKKTKVGKANRKKATKKANKDWSKSIKPIENGRYMVVVGSYSLTSNALTQVQNLKEKGFRGAELVKFNQSALETVLLGRYQSKSQAKLVSNSLNEKHGFNSYVQTK